MILGKIVDAGPKMDSEGFEPHDEVALEISNRGDNLEVPGRCGDRSESEKGNDDSSKTTLESTPSRNMKTTIQFM